MSTTPPEVLLTSVPLNMPNLTSAQRFEVSLRNFAAHWLAVLYIRRTA